MSMQEYCTWKDENPDWDKDWSAGVAGVAEAGEWKNKVDGGFKDVLNKIGAAHPGSEVHSRHGSKDIKREKSVKTIKKHMDIQSRK